MAYLWQLIEQSKIDEINNLKKDMHTKIDKKKKKKKFFGNKKQKEA